MITSTKNPLIKQIRELHNVKKRREKGIFFFEGTHLLMTACEKNCSLVSLLSTEKWKIQNFELWKTASRLTERYEIVSPEVLKSITTTINPDGVIATALFKPFDQTKISSLKLGLILERLQDPGNLGTIIRTAVATNVDSIWLSDDSVNIDNPKVIRASAGAWFKAPLVVTSNLKDIVMNYKHQGVNIVATSPSAKETYWNLNLTQPTIILLGNEGSGLSQTLVNMVDKIIKVPLEQSVESLNVAITTALILYEAKRQKSLI
ncbi:MAG: RNA methyltransferase [Candidatus Atelocyanobacterium thalassa]